MARKFYLGTNTVEDVTFLKITGVIDEDNTLAASVKKIEGRTVIIDLSGVDRINSCGVRDWVNWLNDLEQRGKQVILVRCSPCIVNQINLVNNFVGGGMVKSFFAPYYCARCDKEQLELLQVEAFADMSQPTAPPVRGDGCHEVQCEMDFDDIEASYFAFLPRNTGKVVDERLRAHVESLSPSIQDRIKRLDTVQKQASDPKAPHSLSQYSPLTVTTTGMSLARDSLNRTAPPPEGPPSEERRGRRVGTSAMLLGAAFAVAAVIVAYVVFFIGER